jgi:lipopolysaccharide heptosyltransferase I
LTAAAPADLIDSSRAVSAEPGRRFLIVRLSSIGDIVHALPAVAELGKQVPGAQIDWVVEARYAALLIDNPFLHRVIEVDTLGWRKKLLSSPTVGAMARSIRDLRQYRYDTAIDFQGLFKTGLVSRTARTCERLGFAKPRLRERLAAIFYSLRTRVPSGKHVIEENLALVERLGVATPPRGGWQFPLPARPEDRQWAEDQIKNLGARDFAVVNPGGGWLAKRWPPRNYAELIRRMAGEFPGYILLTGSTTEESMIEEILGWANVRRVRLLRSSLLQFIALVGHARLFVGGDTGPLHLAAAVGTPIVGIYGPTDPLRNGPFARDDIALSNHGSVRHGGRRDKTHYLDGITVDAVMDAIKRRIAA